MSVPSPADAPAAPRRNAWEVRLVLLRLGLTWFGGPVAHLGYFRDFVAKRRWLEKRACADLVALCRFLPDPASGKVGSAASVASLRLFLWQTGVAVVICVMAAAMA